MDQVIVPALLGLFLIILGGQNYRGNINSLHRYHRHRVTEADKPAFARLIGSGTILCGVGLLLYALGTLLAQLLRQTWLSTAGAALLLCGLAAGLGLSLYAMIKYNNGIF